jgi:tetratricopeptide (TPR) repeat protein
MNEEQEEAKLWEKVASTDGEVKVDALLDLSYKASNRSEYAESLALCETAREVYEGLGATCSAMKLAHIYFGIGHALRHLKRPVEAAGALSKSATLYQEVGAEDAFHLLNEEGDAWYEAKEYQKAFDAYQRAIEDTNPDKCDGITARNYIDAGMALEKLRDWRRALGYFSEGRARYKELKDLKVMAHCDEEISLCHVWLGDGASALVHAQLALDYAVTAEDEVHFMWAKARLALANKSLGQYQDAIDLFAEAKSLMVIQANPPWKSVIKLERQVADILKKLGKNEESEEVLRRISSFEEMFLDEYERAEEIV